MPTSLSRTSDSTATDRQSLAQVIARETALTAAAASRAAWRTWQSMTIAGIRQLTTCGRVKRGATASTTPVSATPIAPAPASSVKAGSLELFSDADDSHRFRLTTGDGETIVTSRSYQDARSARSGMLSFMKNAVLEDRYTRRTDALDAHVFDLKAGNNRVIWTSPPFESEHEMEADLARLIRTVREASKLH
jgi:uncharacterized protein YegP (UPF0339 family)